MQFKDPIFLILLPIIVLAFIYIDRRRDIPGINFSSEIFLTSLKPTLKLRIRRNLKFLRIASMVLIILALARLQAPLEETKRQAEGIDIVLAIDCSTSMLAEDFTIRGVRINRLEAVKDVVEEFIKGRQSDRIGITAFAGRAYTVCPLTLDYSWLLKNLERIKIGAVEDGTAIGSGISTALNRLKDTEAKGKVIVLLTDGRNNAGKISPAIAAEAAKALGVKIYTIGAGTKGYAPYPAKNIFGNFVYRNIQIDIDEETLIDIASKTNAKYYRATDTESLRKIYKEINKLEKVIVQEKGYYNYKELFSLFLSLAIILLFVEIILKNTVLRIIP
ncbi:MAG: VWA domain-containing protein [Candidatus Omnitrophica bacterium]|nr:VWA domain-containing protein [Candidatus Omnitrophota bacterium]